MWQEEMPSSTERPATPSLKEKSKEANTEKVKERVAKRKQRKEKDALEKTVAEKEAPEDKLALLPMEASAVGLVLLILLASFYVVSSFSTSVGPFEILLHIHSSLVHTSACVDTPFRKSGPNRSFREPY
jgi:uncharacterized membrane protein YdbT with pleckstrin-like domain